MEYLTPAQCRAARALLGWSQPDLARRCGMHVQTISAFENETGTPTRRTLGKITDTLEHGGVEFLPNEGVGRKSNPITNLRGTKGFSTFMDDVYFTTKDLGGEICIFNVDERNWEKWLGRENWLQHEKRMLELGDKVTRKIFIKEGDAYVASSYSFYKWFPKGLFGENSFYSYRNKLALIKFLEDDVHIMILDESEYTKNYCVLFNIAWEYAGIDIPQ